LAGEGSIFIAIFSTSIFEKNFDEWKKSGSGENDENFADQKRQTKKKKTSRCCQCRSLIAKVAKSIQLEYSQAKS
jgi:hypothetical protein